MKQFIAALMILTSLTGCSSMRGVMTTERGENMVTVYFWNHENDIIEVADKDEHPFPMNIIDGEFLQ